MLKLKAPREQWSTQSWIKVGGLCLACWVCSATTGIGQPAQATSKPLVGNSSSTTQASPKQTPSEQPTIPPLPDNTPRAFEPEAAGIVGLTPGPEADLGMGHLRPQNIASLKTNDWANSPLLNAKWLRGIALPIYTGPSAEHWGWIINGWLIPNNYSPIAIGRDATFEMVQAYPGLYSFPVMELRDDGWFRFQYTPAGTAWAHVSQLNLGSTELAIETWEDRVQNADRLEFRRHGLSQPLRLAPNPSEPLRSLVGPNSLIVPLEVEGDWMRVRVTQPADGCAPLPGSNTEEGWMRWRDSDANVLVWFPAERC